MRPDRIGGDSWWRQAVVYQVYPRSFADANGDGIGDLAGITSRTPYLASLGVDAVWLSPFYPSQLADGGYDVDDHRDVDPLLGSLDDFDELVTALHREDIKLFVDIVPNHSSTRSAWFREAMEAEPGSPARDRFIFRDGRGQSGALPPSDWPSHFGPSAWTRTRNADGTPGQWYLHLFAPEQPDYNWDNEDVREYFRGTLRFWADRGVDGFRIDVAHALVKDLSEPLRSKPVFVDFDNPPTGDDVLFDRNEVHDVYRDWRRIFDEYDPPRVAVAEAVVSAPRRVLYTRSDELHQAFNFDLLNSYWSRDEYHAAIESSLTHAREAGTSSTWVLSNHDNVRHATRYGLAEGVEPTTWLARGADPTLLDPDLGSRRARAATLLMLALPGSAYLYQGEELGLPEVADIPIDRLQDPIWVRSSGELKGRDGCRVPLPWTADGAAFGFGPGASHLPQPRWFADYAVDVEDDDPHSTLSMYRAAISLRGRLAVNEDLTFLPSEHGVLHFARTASWESVTNFNLTAVTLPPGTVMLSSEPLNGDLLPAGATAWIAPDESPAPI
ncbi:glycoside hydrolase family 13 protein [Agromyces sp. Soil535]|uniref:glycoside hydrolase family 13 protein n=1 Tax=Agromyces sp. Soil535 TaxID=1736390 RepID=UPI0006F5187D|nr:glycoside hydrolase family 13 protein [Agromyces sp. Soil535]KRE31380.1 alpha-amylase [Agromyces sp. Soil535]